MFNLSFHSLLSRYLLFIMKISDYFLFPYLFNVQSILHFFFLHFFLATCIYICLGIYMVQVPRMRGRDVRGKVWSMR